MNEKQFGEFLKQKRKEKSLTTTQLAELSGLSQSYISNVENGRRTKPKPETIYKFAEALGLDYSDLMVKAGYINEEQAESNNETGKTALLNELESLKSFRETSKKGGYLSEEQEEILKENEEELLSKIKEFDWWEKRVNEKHDNDILNLIETKEHVFYNGHELTYEDKQKLIGALKVVFQEYIGRIN